MIDAIGLWQYATEYDTHGHGLTRFVLDIENTVDTVFKDIAGRDAIVTYTTNGTHMPNSFHYSGLAVDLRTRDLTNKQIKQIVRQLRNTLGSSYYVVFHDNHIHIEYDPPASTDSPDACE